MTDKISIPLSQGLQIIVFIVGLAVVWGSSQAVQASMAARIDDQEVRIRALELGLARIEEALKPIGRMDDRLRTIEKAVKQ